MWLANSIVHISTPLFLKVAPEEFYATVQRVNSIVQKQVPLGFKCFLLGCFCCCCTAGLSLGPAVILNKRVCVCVRCACACMLCLYDWEILLSNVEIISWCTAAHYWWQRVEVRFSVYRSCLFVCDREADKCVHVPADHPMHCPAVLWCVWMRTWHHNSKCRLFLLHMQTRYLVEKVLEQENLRLYNRVSALNVIFV